MKYSTSLKEKREVAVGTMEFWFEKPAGFDFKAGQFIDVTLVNSPETDALGNTRTFSIAAAPSEPFLAVATRMRDTAFKRVLKNMEADGGIEIEGPMGSFTLHQNISRPAVFLIGGIGITPVLSIIKDATEKKLPHKIYLFYSNRRPEDAAFFEELLKLTGENSNFVFVSTMTEAEKSAEAWHGETGYINKKMIDKYVKNIANAVYYTAGPLAMVVAMREILTASGISDNDIKTEEFSGY